MGEAKADGKAPKKSWFKGLKSEFGKIIWPSKSGIAKQTTAVVIISLILGVIIKIVDYIVAYGLEFIF